MGEIENILNRRRRQYEYELVELQTADNVDNALQQECDQQECEQLLKTSIHITDSVDPYHSNFEPIAIAKNALPKRSSFSWGRIVSLSFFVFALVLLLHSTVEDSPNDSTPPPVLEPNEMEQEEAYSHQSTPTFSQTPTNHSSTSSLQFGSPFIVLTEGGCSGTTAVGHYIRNIVSMHGFHKTEHVNFEFLHANQYNSRKHKHKNQYYQDIVTERNMTKEEEIENYRDLVIESIERAQEVAIETKSLMFFKANVKQYKKLHSRLDDLDGGASSYAGVYRENILDRCICMVRDCFHEVKDFGISVFGANGTEADLCFDRRFHPEVDVQAYFTNVKGCLKEDEWRVNFICGQGFDSFSSENLFLFETSMEDNDFEASVNTWMEFVKPLLQDELEWDLVASALEEGRGTRTEPSSQENKVYNYEEVKEEMTGINEWEGQERIR
mmetsp:Transcript_10196/g.20507  ORF Transcript_10196/g.20507 Transcript_10196/m.20507 type:complete len:440 (-) Transcript_10196:84-1403(-)